MKSLILAVLMMSGSFPIAAQNEWRQYVSSEGRFSASMPREPISTVSINNTGDGQLVTHISSVTDVDLNEFLISWTEYPDKKFQGKNTAITFERARNALVQVKEGKVLDEAAIDVNGHSTIVTTFATSEGKTVSVFFVISGNRIYQVLAETLGKGSEARDRFLKSFTLLPGKPV
jgi:hypothetical protein